LLRAPGVRAAVRGDLVPTLAPWILARTLTLPDGAEPVDTGRGGTYRALLPGNLRAVVRLYRRGGLVARVVRRTYLGVAPRPLRELIVTAEARRRGVATAEVLAARVEGGLLYRGALVTAELADSVTLVEALRHARGDGLRHALATATARAIAAMHDAGVMHADLNLTNILVRMAPAATVAALIDFDRARLTTGPLGPAARRRSLRRLARSLRKLDPGGALAGPRDVAAFRDAYGEATGSPCGC
jgi:3-deoxy-D-manno-octulosonic acid kinase